MFDIITIDFSRYGANIGFKTENGTPLPAVFAMGVVSALLAGACVAPVVIAVLLYSMTKYAEGEIAALLLPFLLGVGMASPWPVVGGGMASLPKPGKWMVRVKQLFGVFIIIMAGYYAWLGISILRVDESASTADSIIKLETALRQAERENRPVFLDFWATWCKNCSRMESSTFQNPEVRKALSNFVVVKFQAEKPNRPDVKKILDEFKILGLPGYVVLRPTKGKK
jgi:thiol:disulfide interchange protein